MCQTLVYTYNIIMMIGPINTSLPSYITQQQSIGDTASQT